MTDPTELILSASSLKTYLSCGYKYMIEHIWRVPGTPTMDMAIGTAVHAGVEALHKGLPDPVETTETTLLDQMAAEGFNADIAPARALNEANRLLEMYRTNIAPGFHPTMVEKDFVIRARGVLISGRIDAADEDVHDTKTTATLTKFRPERHILQMTIYRLGYWITTGRWPRRLLLDVLARNGRWKQVEVQPDDQEMITAIELAKRGIIAGDFEPTGALNGSCSRCPYSTGVCTYARLD